MSSTDTSGTPAEGSATPPAPAAEFPSFGTTRGSGLARGKRHNPAAAAPASAAPSDYKPTAIEVVHAPREYTNPFAPAAEAAPAEQPAAPAASPESVAPAAEPAKPVVESAPAPSASIEQPAADPAELNILPPAAQRSAPAQTWESEGFTPARESRRQHAAPEPAEEVDIASIPPQFLYVRPGVKFVPTPRNWGGAPRERKPASDRPARSESVASPASRPAAAAPAQSGGFLGWLKGLFGGAAAPEPVKTSAESDDRHDGSRRRHRGGRGGEGGGHRRHRGGRGRSRSRNESEGSRQGGSI